MDENRSNGNEDRTPMPVRAAMESADAASDEQTPLLRQFLDGTSGQQWVAKISGRSTSGVLPLRVIPLMELAFSKAEAPEVPLLKAICQGDTLDDLDDAALLDFLRSAEPVGPRKTESSGPQKNGRRGQTRRGPRR